LPTDRAAQARDRLSVADAKKKGQARECLTDVAESHKISMAWWADGPELRRFTCTHARDGRLAHGPMLGGLLTK
jgi:hypothetical protein